LVARTVAKPLGRLSQETARIRSFDLEGEVGIKSYVREIDDLVQSVATMKTGLRSFGSYVPKSLVGQIVKSEITPEIGGERRNMTVMFTDIVGFTTVSESVSAEDLAVGLSDYFQDVGSVVLAEHGTIDKFIGDSVMAFWNAPLPADNHPALACRAAILACGAAAAGNVSRQEKGLPVFQTRFGLNTGDTIVGNIGSQERMDYTVIGGPVNMAARLEGLNKAYGTTVLISNSVRDGLGAEFLVRSMDVALPKGAVTPIEVFELMGMAVAPAEPETPDAAVEVAPDAEASTDTPDSASTLEGTSPEYRMAGQQCLLRILPLLPIWEQMIAAYRDARFADCAALLAQMEAVVPEDGPTRLYRSRVDALLANPPGPDWTPLTEFLSK
ncbi:MAG: adenylate/guanylate cyclase domain-containing protein, partial [Rhodospirillaceae bacterium]